MTSPQLPFPQWPSSATPYMLFPVRADLSRHGSVAQHGSRAAARPFYSFTARPDSYSGCFTPISSMSKSLLLAHDTACSEFQARALLAASRELLAIVSPAGEFLFVNENFSRVLGYSPLELTGKPLLSLHAASDAALIQKKFASVAAGRHSDSVACRCSLRAHTGQFRWFDAVATNRIADPDVQGIVDR